MSDRLQAMWLGAGMLPLYEKATRYLVRGGYRINNASPGFAIAEYAGDDTDNRTLRILLWVEDEALAASRQLDAAGRQQRSEREDALLREMIAEMQGTPDAVGYYIVPSRQGLSAEFTGAATDTLQRGGRDKRGGVRTIAEFFDTDYKLDTRSGRAAKASALGQMFDRVKTRRRVAQPYMVRTGLGPDERHAGDGDLVEHLDLLFRDPVSRPTLRIIDGPAGGGKTVAFETVAVALYEEFIDAKKQRLARPRPVVFLPDHIRGEKLSGYVDNVIDAAMQAEAARPVEADQLRFLLNQGYGMWLFDGLDEFFGNDNNFFEFLGNELSNPESRAQVLICSRDSLLTSSTALRAFVEQQLAKKSAIEIYELAKWGPEAWRRLAWMELDAGIAGRETSPRVQGFVDALTASPELAQLATLPFYCVVLLEEFRKSSALSADPLAVLDTIVERMLTREGDKLVFQWREFVDLDVLEETAPESAAIGDRTLMDGRKGREAIEQALDNAGRANIREILGEVAHRRVRQARTSDVDISDLREVLGPAYIDARLDGEDSSRVLTAIVQFAFFGAGKKAGAVDFSHPILAEHMAADYALTMLSNAREHIAGLSTTGAGALSKVGTLKGAVRQAIGATRLEPTSIFARTLRRGLARDPTLRALLAEARAAIGSGDKVMAANIDLLLQP